MALITINGVSVDPIAQANGLAAAGLHSKDASSSNYILVQAKAPLTAAQRKDLEGLGVVIHEYVPERTYLCGYQRKDLKAIRALPFVDWADIYFRAFKVPPALRPAPSKKVASVVPFEATEVARSRRTRDIDLILHEDVDSKADPLKTRIAAAAGIEAGDLKVGTRKVRLTLEERKFDQIAALDEVHHLEEVPKRHLFNNVARTIINADVLVNNTPFRGEGEVVAVADTGFDKGSTTDVHPAFSGRVANLYALGRPKSNDPHGHGTHVAGSAVGDGMSASMGGAIQGTAPAALLVLQSMLDSAGYLGGIPIDLHDLFEPPYDNDGARVHTNSWGATTPGLPYDASAREIDETVWERPDLVICFAAGNDGTDANADGNAEAGSIGSQSAAKNCITVGASESFRREFERTYGDYWPSDFPADPIRSDLQASDPDGLVAFSSRGPTQEGRIKPDVVAPGTCILSTLSRDVASAPSDFGTSSDPLYFFDSGTSMATPLVAGCAAVLRETLVKNGMATPTAALIKALLINGAVDLPGQYTPSEAGASPNRNSGFGRVDLAGSIILPGPNGNAGFGEGGPLEQGEESVIEIDIPAHGVPRDRASMSAAPMSSGVTFKITLVWSDPAGAELQNDLDLIVRAADGSERHGNMGTSTKFDRSNNVERVLWTHMPAGKASIIVRAHRITKFAQPYAYAWRIR